MTLKELTTFECGSIGLYDLTKEEAIRQNRRDTKTLRRSIVRCTLQRWLGFGRKRG